MLLSRAHRPIDLSVKWGALVAGSTCSLLVAGPRGRIALRVPPTVTVAELLADACAALGGETEDAGHWVLATPRGEALDPERSVGQLNLLDGALLVLRAASQAEAANIREDLPEAVGASLEEAPGRWSAQAADTLAAVFASALALLSAVVVWRATPELTRAELAFGGGLGLVVVCVLLSRFTPMARTAMWMALAALPMFAIGGGSVMSVVPAGMPAAAALGLLAGGVLILSAVPGTRAPAIGVVLASVIYGLGTAPAVTFKLPAAVPIVIVVLLALAALGLLPRIAVQTAGVLQIDSSTPTGGSEVARSVAEGHSLLAWMLVGICALFCLPAAQLAINGSPWVLALVGVVGLVTVLRARHHVFVAEIIPLAVTALACLVAVEAGLLFHHMSASMVPFVGVGVAIGDAILVIALAMLANGQESSLDTRRWLSRLEYLVDAAVIPVAIGAFGVYDFVFGGAKHLM